LITWLWQAAAAVALVLAAQPVPVDYSLLVRLVLVGVHHIRLLSVQAVRLQVLMQQAAMVAILYLAALRPRVVVVAVDLTLHPLGQTEDLAVALVSGHLGQLAIQVAQQG
jgi:hypothetical protein